LTPAAQFLLALLALLPSTQAQTLLPRLDGDSLSVQLPNFNLLSGKPLQRLKNGQSVAYDFHLQWLDASPGNSSATTGKIVARSAERFVISYDLWEENYSIVHLSTPNQKTPITRIARLKSEAVSTWCLGRLRLPLFQMTQADKSRPTRLQIEIRSAAPKLPNPIRAEGTLDLGLLIDIFSRPPADGELRFTATSAPFTLISLATP
jgi:hypothetical protein